MKLLNEKDYSFRCLLDCLSEYVTEKTEKGELSVNQSIYIAKSLRDIEMNFIFVSGSQIQRYALCSAFILLESVK